MEQQQSYGTDDDMVEVFVSYHFTTTDLKNNGFGNFVGKFSRAVYTNKSTFIQHLEEHISLALKSQLKIECGVKVLFFK